MILFTSDYTEGAHPRIIEKLAETNMEQTVGYGEDPYCEAAREAIKKVCDAPDADERRDEAQRRQLQEEQAALRQG